MKRVELLAPAGDLEKLKIAILYGADAVFIGGKKFSLRAKASNFTIEDIKEACEFAHQFNKQVHVTVNIYPHEKDLDGLKEYLNGFNRFVLCENKKESIQKEILKIKESKVEWLPCKEFSPKNIASKLLEQMQVWDDGGKIYE